MRKSQCQLPVGHVVVALSGRERGQPFLVIRPQSGTTIFLADGKSRTFERPKAKNVRHVRDYGKPPDVDDWLHQLAALPDAGVRNAQIRSYLKEQWSRIIGNDQKANHTYTAKEEC